MAQLGVLGIFSSKVGHTDLFFVSMGVRTSSLAVIKQAFWHFDCLNLNPCDSLVTKIARELATIDDWWLKICC